MKDSRLSDELKDGEFKNITIKPIGKVIDENVIEIFEEYTPAIKGIEEANYIWILYFFHLADERLEVHPKGDIKRPLRGVFSTRSPYRPNRIGMTAVKLLKVENNKVFVKGLDALPNSPIIDIKPYSEVYDLPYGSVLNMQEIAKRIVDDGLIRHYIDLDIQLQPNGFDFTLKSVFKVKGDAKVDFDNSQRVLPDAEEIEFKDDWVFLPKGFYRIVFNEVVKLSKDLMAIGRPRSTLVRSGANVLTAVWDAGYEGRSEAGLVVYNENGIWLKRNARVMQLVFIKLTGETKPYAGVYHKENL